MIGLYKQVFGYWKEGFPSVREHLSKGSDKKIYDPTLESKYSEEEWIKINSWIDHNRDWTFTYAGLRQVVDKYLVQDRSTTEVYESPQFMYMLISAAIFGASHTASFCGFKKAKDSVSLSSHCDADWSAGFTFEVEKTSA